MKAQYPRPNRRKQARFHVLIVLGLSLLAFGSVALAHAGQNARASQSPPALIPSPTRSATSTSAHPSTPVARTLLDEVGNLARPLPDGDAARWKAEIHAAHAAPNRAAQLHLWLGEWELAVNQEPKKAAWHFRQTQQSCSPSSTLYGLAAYDRAIVLFYEGAFGDATAAFRHLLDPKTALWGFSRNMCALWYRHAGACAGYHAEHAALGIPEPPRLDPLCGAAGLAACLRALGLPYDKRAVLSACRVTGEGSTLQDLLDASKTLGVAAHAVTADDQGLKSLPVPLVSFVERDHFVAVVRADKQGVSYLCSDCGAWPGGRVNLTWKQWHALNPGPYLTLCRHGSIADKALQMLAADSRQAGIRLAAQGPLSRLHLRTTSQILALYALFKGHVLLYEPTGPVQCGSKPPAQHCGDWLCCPEDGSSRGNGGSSDGDPINLATGEEEYSPAPDLFIYNPIGPSVAWSRFYNSLRSPAQIPYEYEDFGVGWSHPYNMGVTQYSSGGSYHITLALPNGAQVNLTSNAAPTSSKPRIQLTVPTGIPLLMEWDYDSGTGSNYFIITLPDRTKWITTDLLTVSGSSNIGLIQSGHTLWYPLSTVVDRNGNYIKLNYTIPSSGYPYITSIVDSNNSALLSITRNNVLNYAITSVTDRYGRTINYHVGSYATVNVPPGYPQNYMEVDQVSQINSSTLRYAYGYSDYSNTLNTEQVPFLTSITVPSPTGTGSSETYIAYDSTNDAVATVTDANNCYRTYTAVDGTHTKISYYDAQGHLAYSHTVGFDNNMSWTTDTDGTNSTIVLTATYSDPNDPDKPSSIKNGNNDTWSYAWDKFGHLKTCTTPRNTTTTLTWSYTSFALGELTKAQGGTNLGSGAKSPMTFAYYEPSGLLKSITAPLPGTTGSTSTVTASYSYDLLGNLLSVTAPGNNAATSIVTTLNYTTDGSYTQPDAIGQPLTITDNLNNVSHFRYDARGNCASATDALGNETDASFNLANQPTQVIFPATGQTGTGRGYIQYAYEYLAGPLSSATLYDESGNQARQVVPSFGKEGEFLTETGVAEPVTLTYDGAYRITSIQDGKNNVTSRQFNLAGYLSQISFPLANGTYDTIQFPSYDNIGNPLKRIDGNNVETDYVYNDPESRLTNINYPASASLDVSLGYDAYSLLDTMTDGSGSTAFNFDDDNNLIGSQVTYTGLSAKTLSYTFYPDGSRETMSTPAGSFTYQYDADGRPSQLTNPYSETFAWSFLTNSWISQQQSKNASGSLLLSSVATLNAWGLPTEWINKNGSGGTLSDFGGSGSNTIGYDAAADLTSLPVTLSGQPSYSGTSGYGYDPLSQLLSEQSSRNGGYTNSFLYDSAGNPTTFRGASLTFNADNQNQAIAYDGNGNPSFYNGNTLTFDAENRLSGYGSQMSASYTGEGLRAEKQVGSSVTYFLYDGGLPVCELDGYGNVSATNTFGALGLLARHTSSGSVFYSFDPIGNVCQRLDANGNVLGSYLFDSYGNRTSTDDSNDPYSGLGGQAGYYTDWETGLSLLGYRYYDPTAGRFLNRDPIGYSGGMNLYGYVENSPTNGLDPSGLTPCFANDDGSAAYDNCYLSDLNAGDHPGLAGAQGFSNYMLGSLIPGYGFIPAIRGKDCWGCPLSPMQRVMSAVSGGLSAMPLADVADEGMAADASMASSTGCFVAGTHMAVQANSDATGKPGNSQAVVYPPIEQVKRGALVASCNPQTGKMEFKRVERTTVRKVARVVRVGLSEAATAAEVEAITATPEHPFYEVGKGFVKAEELGIGSQVVTRAGPPLVVTSLTFQSRKEGYTVYNLVVEDDHTYFVGTANGGVWVHNPIDCGMPSGLGRAADELLRTGSTYLPTREQAGELFYRMFGTEGFRNTTGFNEAGAAQYFGSLENTYHWDEALDEAGNLAGHGPDNPDRFFRHLQIELPGGDTLRIKFGSRLP